MSATPPDRPPAEAAQLARMLEACGAERDAALDLVDGLERILAKHGGYMSPEDQATISTSRAFLEARGVRPPAKRTEWRNRP